MSFAFGFEGDEYSEDEDLSKSTQTLSMEEIPKESDVASETVKHYTLDELIKMLPLSLAYSTIDLLDHISIPRRELWDIKHQLMSGTGDSTTTSSTSREEEEEEIMKFMGRDDVIQGVYEGGFKTWECSIDLARYLAQKEWSNERTRLLVVELGCGTSLPMLVVLMAALKAKRSVRLIVQDYNAAVLQFSTLPNLYLAWASLDPEQTDKEWEREGEVRVTEESRDRFLMALAASDITIEGLSGSWSRDMSTHIGQADLILASETIYSTKNLSSFVHVLKQTLKHDGEALVAAKCVYFGVGGGVEVFTREVTHASMHSRPVFESNIGVRRTILSIKQN